MESADRQSRFFEAEPLEGESLSHFLGRFRRANYLTSTGLGKLTGLGAVIARWEKFYLNPFPSRRELEALAAVVGVEADRLAQMLPPLGVGMNHSPIRLCGACYTQEPPKIKLEVPVGETSLASPCHRIEWQFKTTAECNCHQLRLLSKCPNCGARFAIPAEWVEGGCQRCFMTFAEMAKSQKAVF